MFYSYFENLACEALKISYEMNQINTLYLLIKKINEFSGITSLQIAISAECLNFLSQPACQNLLEKIWYNKMLPDTHKLNVYRNFNLK